MGLRETYRRLGRLKSHGVNHHVSCQFLSLSSQRPQAAINSPAALPLQRGNELGNNRSHKGQGRQRLQSLFSAHPVCTPWGYCEILPTKEPSPPSPPTGNTETGRARKNLLHPSSPACLRQQKGSQRAGISVHPRTPVEGCPAEGCPQLPDSKQH